MIETPVKAPPAGGPPSAPPPDARTRVMDPPPDPSGRHVHACAECGLPLHPDQAACLSCGAMVEHGSGFAGIRRAAVGSATALMVLGSAVGAAVAGLPNGKDVPKKSAQAQVFGPKKDIPPATADLAPGTGSDGELDLPGADGGSKPPAIAPKAPRGTDSTSLPDSDPAPSGSVGSGSGSSGGSPTDTNGGDADTDRKPTDNKPDKPRKPRLPSLFVADTPASAAVVTLSSVGSSADAGPTIDSEVKTRWTTRTSDRGIAVEPNPGSYNAIGVITETPGWSLEIYRSDAASPGGLSSGDWTQVAATNAEKRNKIDVPDARWYAVVVADTGGDTVRINEIQVFQ